MKKLLLPVLASVSVTAMAQTTETVNIQGTDYSLVKHQERQIGPGTVYTRYRVPDFPLNINLVKVDVTNPYIKIETSMPNDRAAGTELLVNAAARYDAPDHHAIAAQNSNFWIVSTQPQWAAYNASTHNINMRNGMLAIDSKSFPHWWWWTTERSGIVSATADNELFIDACRTEMTFRSEKLGTREFTNCNKGFKTGQTSIYTPWFGPDRQFLPLIDDTPEQIQNNDIHYDIDENSDCTEVMLRIADSETWSGGRDIKFIVSEVRATKGRGTLGDYDLAIVSRGADLAALTPGDEVFLNYSWVFDRNGQEVRPLIEQAVGGNILVMRHGQITEQNYWDSYNTMVYSRSAYGVSEDGKTLYMMVIDMSNDSYGQSKGCTTAEMCDIMRYLGAWNVVNVDAGGSAELMVDNRIINKTTEGTPRAVGNGWMIFNTAPDQDDRVAALAFYDVTLKTPVSSQFSPRVIAFNKYGTQLTDDYRDFIVKSDEFSGTGVGNTLQAGAVAGKGTLTIETADGVTVSKEIELFDAEPTLARSSVVIDSKHDYPIEIVSVVGKNTYTYDPGRYEWTSQDQSVATVDKDGVIHAVSNGTTKVSSSVGGKDVSIEINVETAPTATLQTYGDWTAWQVKGNSGLKNMVMSADGTLNYTYGAPRSLATITFTKPTTVYGLPTSVVVEFTSDIPMQRVDLNLAAYGKESQLTMSNVPEDGFPADKPCVTEFKVGDLGDVKSVSTYPLTFSALKFTTPHKAEYKGDRTLKITNFYARYDGENSVSDITVEDRGMSVTPNPVEAMGSVKVSASSAIERVEIYSMSGALVSSVPVAGGCVADVTAPAAVGTYIVRVLTNASSSSAILIVR